MDQKSNDVAGQSAVEETTQDSSPQSEETSTKSQTDQEPQDNLEVQSTDEGDAPKADAEVKMSEEERRAFQEMRQERDKYKKELQAREKNESAFDPFRTKPTVQSPQEVKLENYVNPDTGEVDYNGYNAAINSAIQAAARTAQYTAQTTAQSVTDESNARSKYPEVFEDRELEQEVADRWFASQMRGETVSISQIAAKVHSRVSGVVKKAGETARKQALTEVSEKEQAALTASAQTSSPSRKAQSAEDLEQLRRRTRTGDEEATATRLKSVPWQ